MSAPWPVSVPGAGAKRKLDEGAHCGMHASLAAGDLAEQCRQAIAPRVDPPSQAPAGDDTVAFHPLPPELNANVLQTLSELQQSRGGAGEAAQSGRADFSYPHVQIYPAVGSPNQPHTPGLLQPATGSQAYFDRNGSSPHAMDEDAERPHGPQCTSIPQLSVRHHGGTASELWAKCLDCGAFSKVQQDQPVRLCYSP